MSAAIYFRGVCSTDTLSILCVYRILLESVYRADNRCYNKVIISLLIRFDSGIRRKGIPGPDHHPCGTDFNQFHQLPP